MIYQPSPLRYCPGCKQLHLFGEFSKDRQTKDHLSAYCRTCKSARGAKYRRDNPDKIYEKSQRYYARCGEKMREQQRQAYAANPRKKLDATREWQKANPDKVKAANERYAQKYPERIKRAVSRSNKKHRDQRREYERQRLHDHPEKDLIKRHRRAARKRQLPSDFTAADWNRALTYFNGCCAVCGRPAGLWHTIAADHWIPLSSPDCPGTVPTNIVPLCHGIDGCNNSKGTKMPEQWLSEAFDKRKAREVNARIAQYFEHLQSP